MAFTKEEIQQKALQLQQAGASSAKIRQFVELASKDIKEEDDNFFSRIKRRAIGRAEKVEEIVDRPQTIASKALQFAGQTAGLALDIGGEALTSVGRGVSAITPDIIEEPIKRAIKTGASKTAEAYLSTPAGREAMKALQGGVQAYQNFKKRNPEEAGNLEAVINIGAVLPIGKIGKTTITRGAEEIGLTAGKLAGKLETGAITELKSRKQSFVRDLVSPVRTKKIREAQVKRTTETGRGLFKKSIIEPTEQELLAEQAVLKVKGVSPKKTFQQNYNVIQETNKNLSTKLAKDLADNNFIYNENQLLSKLRTARDNLKNNPAIVGDAEKTADKLISEIERRVKGSKKTGADLLQVRKDFDNWVKSQKGANIFDPTSENAFSIANREIRQSINDFIDERAVVDVKNSLKEQSSLYRALDNIEAKAAIEADTAVGRLLQRTGDILGTKNKVVQGVAAALGIGGLGAAATFAPAVATLGGLGLFTYKAGKLVASPELRLGITKILKEIEKATKLLTDTRKIRQLETLADDLIALRDNQAGFAKNPFFSPQDEALGDTIETLMTKLRNTTDKTAKTRLEKQIASLEKQRVENRVK